MEPERSLPRWQEFVHYPISQAIPRLSLQFILRSILILYSHLSAAESVVKPEEYRISFWP